MQLRGKNIAIGSGIGKRSSRYGCSRFVDTLNKLKDWFFFWRLFSEEKLVD